MITPEMVREALSHVPFALPPVERWAWLADYLNNALADPNTPCPCCNVTPDGDILDHLPIKGEDPVAVGNAMHERFIGMPRELGMGYGSDLIGDSPALKGPVDQIRLTPAFRAPVGSVRVFAATDDFQISEFSVQRGDKIRFDVRAGVEEWTVCRVIREPRKMYQMDTFKFVCTNGAETRTFRSEEVECFRGRYIRAKKTTG